jgi:CTP:molybdopterin cytidylyltransferase MocA
VRKGLVRSGGAIASTDDERTVVMLEGDTYTVTEDDPTKVVVTFKNREKPAACPKA